MGPSLRSLAVLALSASAAAEERATTRIRRAAQGAVPRGSAGAVVKEEPSARAGKAGRSFTRKLVKFIDAEYPEAAKAQGLQADVMLRLDIDNTGKVVKAEVMQPVGNGFDEAAQAAALQFEFEPATRGTASPSRFAFRTVTRSR